MDSLTAGIALIVAQLCVALVMTGVYLAAPREKCTRYWALSEILIAAGIVMIVLNVNVPHAVLLLLGYNSLAWGSILQLWGTQAFYKKQQGIKLGWVVGIVFFLLFGLILLMKLPVAERLLLLSATILFMLILNSRELWTGPETGRSFGNILTLGAAGLLILNNAFRIAALLLQAQDFLPTTHSSAGVGALYLVPLGGTLLYGTGLLLLYFERIVEEKHHLATHDELTGMLNRRAIVAGGEREVAMALRNQQPLTIAFVDVDFFKRINDNLGHEAGDIFLVEIAQLLKKTCRNIDLVGRYGGEEFCIIFPGVGQENATTVGERLLNAVRQYRFENQYQMTVSIGFASLSENPKNRSWTNLINRADAALYKAKDFGRNQFCIAEEDLI
ncbi:MAG TPA: GGDEF domain-containing protein [Burkholderiaceae bacterium]|jgi:diguanylate cyclase (GGDEF)-like protein